MDEALKEIWEARFRKAKESEFDISASDLEIEIELLKLKIDLSLDVGNIEKFERYSKKLKSTESFLSLKSN